MNADALWSQLLAWEDRTDEGAMKSRSLVMDLLTNTGEPFSRNQFAPGHVTATGMVLNPAEDAVLVVHHRRLDRWLLPGGHVEPGDADIFAAAAREAAEETSVALDPDVAPYIAGVDVHGIPSNGKEPYHLHHDVVIGFAAASEDIQVSEESRAVTWLRPGQFDEYYIPWNVRNAFANRRLRLK